MVQNESNLVVADNSGARSVRIFRQLGGARMHFSSIGDIVLCAVKEAAPNAKIKKGQIVKAVIVRVKKQIIRKDGSSIGFDDNAVVVVDDDHNPLGTRVFGPVARELREKGYMKIISLATEVL